jgi:hypothetical protein
MAGKGKKTFVAGEVLLAQDVNDYLMDQSVMNFASSAARASAIPTPTEGMTTYVQDRNQIETFDGAEYRGMSGLQLVKKQTIGSGVTSVNVTGAFSATYEAYKIIVSGGTTTTGTVPIRLQLGASTTGYFAAIQTIFYTGAARVDVSDDNAVRFSRVGFATPNNISCNIDLVSPFLAKPTMVSSPYATLAVAGTNSGFNSANTSFTDFTISPEAGTLTGGTIYVYGYGT